MSFGPEMVVIPFRPALRALGSADPSPASSPDPLLRVSPLPGDAKLVERPYTRGVRKEGEDP